MEWTSLTSDGEADERKLTLFVERPDDTFQFIAVRVHNCQTLRRHWKRKGKKEDVSKTEQCYVIVTGSNRVIRIASFAVIRTLMRGRRTFRKTLFRHQVSRELNIRKLKKSKKPKNKTKNKNQKVEISNGCWETSTDGKNPIFRLHWMGNWQ